MLGGKKRKTVHHIRQTNKSTLFYQPLTLKLKWCTGNSNKNYLEGNAAIGIVAFTSAQERIAAMSQNNKKITFHRLYYEIFFIEAYDEYIEQLNRT